MYILNFRVNILTLSYVTQGKQKTDERKVWKKKHEAKDLNIKHALDMQECLSIPLASTVWIN